MNINLLLKDCFYKQFYINFLSFPILLYAYLSES